MSIQRVPNIVVICDPLPSISPQKCNRVQFRCAYQSIALIAGGGGVAIEGEELWDLGARFRAGRCIGNDLSTDSNLGAVSDFLTFHR